MKPLDRKLSTMPRRLCAALVVECWTLALVPVSSPLPVWSRPALGVLLLPVEYLALSMMLALPTRTSPDPLGLRTLRHALILLAGPLAVIAVVSLFRPDRWTPVRLCLHSWSTGPLPARIALVLACLAAFVAVPAVLAVLVPGDEGSGK